MLMEANIGIYAHLRGKPGAVGERPVGINAHVARLALENGWAQRGNWLRANVVASALFRTLILV